MPAPRSRSILVAAARLHYLDGKSQGEVAKELDLSRSSVSRILAAAREQGIVEIRIHPEGSLTRCDDLEQMLVARFGLSDATVVTRPNGRTPVDVVAEMGARIFEERLAGRSAVGLSWGQTVSRLVDHVVAEPIYPHLNLYALVGGMPTMNTGPAGNDAIETLARKTGARVHRFEAPAVVESRVTWAALSKESSIVRAASEAASVQAAVVGIGSVGVHASQRVVEAMQLDADETDAFLAQNPVGDICGYFYDADGQLLGPPSSERVIGITPDGLRGIPRVAGIAAGVEKAPGVLGALRTGILEALIVDEDLAHAVLRRAQGRADAS